LPNSKVKIKTITTTEQFIKNNYSTLNQLKKNYHHLRYMKQLCPTLLS